MNLSLFQNLLKIYLDCVYIIKNEILIIKLHIKFNNNMLLTNEQLSVFTSFVKFLNGDGKTTRTSPLFLLSGSAGVGKTFLSIKMIHCALKLYKAREIAVLCPTHKALNVIRTKFNDDFESIDLDKDVEITFQTISKFLAKCIKYTENGTRIFKNTNNINIEKKIIFIDEASMITDEDFQQFIRLNYYNCGVKLIFIGDYAQLEPIENKGQSKIFDDDYIKTNNINVIKCELKQVIRSKNNEIGELYETFRNFVDNRESDDDIEFKKEWYDENIYKSVLFVDKKSDFYELITNHFTLEEERGNCKIIAYRNEMVKQYNLFVRNALFKNPIESYVVGEHLVFNEPYNDVFHNNDEIEIVNVIITNQLHPNGFTYKVYEIETKCGEKIIALHEESKLEYLMYFNTIKAQILSKSKSKNSANKLWTTFYKDLYLFNPPWSYAYAITTHKAQGSTIDVCFIDLHDIFYTLLNVDSKSIEKTLYTAISRASTNLYCLF